MSVPNGGEDGGSPLVILGEYNPSGPLPSSSVFLPAGVVQDVKFYGASYNFILYALAWVTNGPYANEQTFQVVAEEGFTNNSATIAVTNTLPVTNFMVNAGDFLAFCGQGPYYPQNPNDATNSDATYQDPNNPNSSTATLPGPPGSQFTVGVYTDISATNGYITDFFQNQGRTYGIGADILLTNGYTFFTIAGQAATNGSIDGFGTNALFDDPQATAVAPNPNLDVFMADTGNNRIRKVAPLMTNWLITTIAGSNGFGSADGIGTNAQFYNPEGIAVSSNETVFVADTLNDTIRMMTFSNNNWVVSTIAGIARTTGINDGTNVAGYFAKFDGPVGIAVDIHTNVFVADTTNDTIREITLTNGSWVVSTIAGLALSPGFTDGSNGPSARFDLPEGIAVDAADNLFVADSGNNEIREITPQGPKWVVTTIAGAYTNNGSTDGTGTSAKFNNPGGIAVDFSDDLFVTDTSNDTVRAVVPWNGNWFVNTVGGLATNPGYADGTGVNARFRNPRGIGVDWIGNLFVDQGNPVLQAGIAIGQPMQDSGNVIEVAFLPMSVVSAGATLWTAVQSSDGWVKETAPEQFPGSQVTLTLQFTNIPFWTSPPTTNIPVAANHLYYVTAYFVPAAPPTLMFSNDKSLWISGAPDATYEIDWTNNWTNGAWQNGKWPPANINGVASNIMLIPGSTQQVATWKQLMQANSPTQALFRAKWTGY